MPKVNNRKNSTALRLFSSIAPKQRSTALRLFSFTASNRSTALRLFSFTAPKGFTLVELILYVALVGILLTAAMIFASDVVLGSVKGRVRAQVQSEARFAMEKMRQEIVRGNNIIAPSRENTTTKISDLNNVGYYTSIAIGTDGLPIISHGDITSTDLAITKCGNASCSAGNTTTKISDLNNVGSYTSIAIGTDGLPIISYRDITSTDLAITKCGNASCSAGNTTTKISDPDSVDYYTSIAIGTDGLPIISHGDATSTDLAITKCGNASCSAGNTTTKISDLNNVGSYTSIAIGTDGLPIISYRDITSTDLAITKCGNASCSAGNTTTKISDLNNVGYYTSIAIGTDGLPIISYFDSTSTDLAITKCGNASCVSYSGNILKIEIISTLTCFQVSNNVFQMSEGGTVSPSICDTNWKDLTSQNIEVTAINFTNISSGTSLGEEAVKINLTLKKKNPGGKKEFDAEVNLETSIALRL